MSLLLTYLVPFTIVGVLALFGVFNSYSWLSSLLQENSKSSIKHLFYALLFFIPAPIYVLSVIDKLPMEFLIKPAIVIFILSSFFGLSVFLLFIHSVLTKKIKNALITLLMGAVVFIFFAPSAYFTFTPIVDAYYKSKEESVQTLVENCNKIRNDYYCMQVARTYIEGNGVEQNYSKAIELYQKASDTNHSFSTYELGVIYEKGKITEKNLEKSTKYYEKSCQLGSSSGCLKLANSYFEGRGVKQDRKRAESTYFKYCIGGLEEGCSYYLDLHHTKSLKKYSTDKEFGGKLENNPSNWSRAFGTALPGNITVLKSLFTSSYSWCCTEYSFYFKVEMNKRDREQALLGLKQVNEVPTEDIFPQDFLEDKILENYRVYTDNDVLIWVNKTTNYIYIHNNHGYIDGR